jgi:plastocyanin
VAAAVIALGAAACSSGSTVSGGPTTGPVLTSGPSTTAPVTSAPATHHPAHRRHHHHASASPAATTAAPTTAPATHSPSPHPTTHSPTPTTSPTPKACAKNSHTTSVSMVNDPTEVTNPYQFSPRAVSIACGGSVTVTNKTSTTHTFSPRHGGFRDTGNVDPSHQRSVFFFYKGSYGFYCMIHSNMTGTVTVT